MAGLNIERLDLMLWFLFFFCKGGAAVSLRWLVLLLFCPCDRLIPPF